MATRRKSGRKVGETQGTRNQINHGFWRKNPEYSATSLQTPAPYDLPRQKDKCTLLLDPKSYFARLQRRHPPVPRKRQEEEPPKKERLDISLIRSKRHFVERQFWNHGILP